MKSASCPPPVRSPRPSPVIHHPGTLRQLAEAATEAWAALARWRVQPPLVDEWERAEAGLRRAGRAHASLLAPMGEGFPTPSADTFPAFLNVSAHGLACASFEARWFVARTQEGAQEDWLLAHAPVVFSPAPWSETLEATLRARGLPSEAPGSGAEEAEGLASHVQAGGALLECLPHLHALTLPLTFGRLLGSRGVEWLRAWLLSGVDVAVVALATEAGGNASRLRAFVSLRSGLADWGPYQPLAAYARACLAELGVPAHLQGDAPPLRTTR